MNCGCSSVTFKVERGGVPNQSPMVFAAIRALYQNYESIYITANHPGMGFTSLSLARMEDEEALEWVKSLLEKAVLDGEPIEVRHTGVRADRYGE